MLNRMRRMMSFLHRKWDSILVRCDVSRALAWLVAIRTKEVLQCVDVFWWIMNLMIGMIRQRDLAAVSVMHVLVDVCDLCRIYVSR